MLYSFNDLIPNTDERDAVFTLASHLLFLWCTVPFAPA